MYHSWPRPASRIPLSHSRTISRSELRAWRPTLADSEDACLHITGDADADALLSENPLALLTGMLLDQRVA